MLRLSLRNIGAHKRRLVSTSLSVIIGIAFLTGTFIFGDSITRAFDNLFANVYKDTDAVVRSSNSLETDFAGTQRARIPDDLVQQVAQVPGVTTAVGDVQGYARIFKANGSPIGQDQGPPTFGSSITDSPISPWVMQEGGRYPAKDDELVIDDGSFKAGDFALGDRVTVTSQAGTQQFTLVGVVKFGDADSPGGATFALFTLPEAQRFVGKPGFIDSVLVAGDGTQEQLADSIRQRLGDDQVEVVTGKTITKENQDDIEEALSFFTILVSVFAGVAIFVSIFVIYNTFSIIVAQRQRETALIRALGASRRQVVGSVFIEAFVTGLVASLLGLVGGVGMSYLLTAAFSAFGIDIPSSGLVLQTPTIVTAILVGLVVTSISAVAPAISASRIPPVAAMRAAAIEDTRTSRGRAIAGLVLLAVGVAAVAGGLSGTVALLGLGIPVLFVALFVLGPLIARPLAGTIGRPLARFKGITGQLARENATRNPKRTANTAAALLVGVALVAGIAAVASSAKSSFRHILGEQFTGDYALSSASQTGLPASAADELNALPEVEAAAGVQIGYGVVEGSTNAATFSVIDPKPASVVFDFDMLEGDMAALDDQGILLSRSEADDRHLAVGDPITIRLLDGVPRQLTVEGIYDKDELAGPFTITKGLFAQSGADIYDFSVFIQTKPGVSAEQAKTALASVAQRYQAADLQSRTDYIDSQTKQIDGFLAFIYMLLAMAVLLAVMGIANVLSLSVHERTRELGLLRAVGGSRRQVRTTIRWESVITSVLGAAEGIVVGVALGYAVVFALRDDGLSRFTLPVATVVAVVVIAFVLGVLAAILPARRAARLNVLQAIASD